MFKTRVEEAIEEIKKGHMVIMIDDEDRENEGDLVYAASLSTPDHVTFMATHGRGLICVALTKDIAHRLDLDPMVQNNDAQYQTAFTVSVDDKDATTGISSGERNMTIRRLSSPVSRPSDLLRPGHIFPLVAKDGGVLVRTGHTEGSVDLCHLAGVAPVGVICEIVKEDGEMARRDDLQEFAKTHHLKTVYISDLVEYRLLRDGLVEKIDSQEVEFLSKKVKKVTFRDHTGGLHYAYVFGELTQEAFVKFHNIGTDVDLLEDSCRFEGLSKGVNYLQKHSGVLVVLSQKPQDGYERMKDFGIGAQILKALNVLEIKLLVNQETGHDFISLQGFGLKVSQEVVMGNI